MWWRFETCHEVIANAVVVKSLHWNLELKPGFVRPHTR